MVQNGHGWQVILKANKYQLKNNIIIDMFFVLEQKWKNVSIEQEHIKGA
jgi:hypothetical protein